ncbi:hypothetical protein LOZ07_006259 [Ophidiomyces ophidiicola]|nr:hypothetical protein LOZ48_005496 [Ophidiomyces ophidiicola]KAI2287900.1 hypothetical protein LOZ07_006259 [Ophidiomyces ophidiicola]KAI2365646.1 hypothetical protein LOY89_006265 [Ophidiomyces ophidiicola]
MSKAPSRPVSQVSSPSKEASAEDNGAQQLTVAVDDLLDQLQHRFTNVSNEILGKLDDMTRRLDELEASLSATNDANRGT